MREGTVSWLAVGILSLSSAGWAQQLAVDGRFFSEVSTEVETPHTPWARPYYKGKVRVLFIAPRPCMRDAVELAQRLDLEFQAVPTYMRNRLGGVGPVYARIPGLLPGEVEEKILRALRRGPEVIVVGNILWNILPLKVEYEILRQVHDGAGLVLAYIGGETEHLKRALEMPPAEDEHNFILSGIPLSGLPAWKEIKSAEEARRKLVTLLRFKRGRIALLNFGRASANNFLIPYSPPELVDYYISLTAKAVLWAARREPDVYFTEMSILDGRGKPARALDRASMKKARIRLTLESERPYPKLTLLFRLRDEEGREILRHRFFLSLSRMRAQKEIPLPTLVSGGYFSDFILRWKGMNVNWGSVYFEVHSSPEIKEVKPDKPWVKPGEEVRVTISLTGPAPEGAKAMCKLEDNLGRLLDVKSVSIPEGDASVSVNLRAKRPLANLAHIRASLFVGEEEFDRASASLPVDLPPLPRMSIVFSSGEGAATITAGDM